MRLVQCEKSEIFLLHDPCAGIAGGVPTQKLCEQCLLDAAMPDPMTDLDGYDRLMRASRIGRSDDDEYLPALVLHHARHGMPQLRS